MRTRPVRADELDLFVEAAASPDHRREVGQYLQSMFSAGSKCPEWCFVAWEREEDRPLGRVAFWTLPAMEEPFALVLLDVPWDGDYMGVGTRLLGDVLDEARTLGAKDRARPRLPADATPGPTPPGEADRVTGERRVRLQARDGSFRVAGRGVQRRARAIVIPHAGGGRRRGVRRGDEEGLRGNARS